MSDVETRFLPLLPLSSGVVLPQMVVPLSLESDEAKAAADAAHSAGYRFVAASGFPGAAGFASWVLR